MLLDRLLAHLTVDVDPFALCLVSSRCRLRLPGPPATMLHFVLQGEGIVRGPGDEAFRVAPRWLAVVPRGMKHALETGEGVLDEVKLDEPPAGAPVHCLTAGTEAPPALRVACGIVRVRYGPTLGLFDHLTGLLAVDLSDAPQVGTAFDGILAEQSRSEPGERALTAALMTQCLVYLLRRLAQRAGSPLPWLAALEDERLSRVIDRILAAPGANHSVESLADVASMSRSAFAERFTSALDQSPMGFLHHVRMQQAARLLRQSATLSVDEVASQVGYSSRSHFSEAFRKHHGAPPTAFRRSD